MANYPKNSLFKSAGNIQDYIATMEKAITLPKALGSINGINIFSDESLSTKDTYVKAAPLHDVNQYGAPSEPYHNAGESGLNTQPKPKESSVEGFICLCKNCGSVAVPLKYAKVEIIAEKNLAMMDTLVIVRMVVICDSCGTTLGAISESATMNY